MFTNQKYWGPVYQSGPASNLRYNLNDLIYLIMNKSIFKPDKRYSFSDYFYMNHPTAEIIAQLGYHLDFEEIQLELAPTVEPNTVEKLKNFYYRLLPKITINSEIAKRELMIAPLIYEVILNLDAKLNVEYPIDMDR